MKKIISLLILIAVIIPFNVYAASGTIKVTSSSTAVYGNTITFTVTLSSSTKIGSWEMLLSYDKDYLSLSSTNSEGSGTKMVNSSTSGLYTKTYTYTFKALKTGSTTVSVSSYDIYDFSTMESMSISTTSKTITIKTQAEIEASYSKDNSLKSLEVDGYEFDEEFSSDVYEYNVVVPEGTDSIVINATENDSTASVSGDGEKEVTSGLNAFEVLVTAQNGDEQVYKVNVEVIDENPINVTLDNGDYTVVKLEEYLTSPSSFSNTTVTIDEFEIPAFYNELLDYTLVGLKNSEGEISLYIYDESDGSFVLYVEMSFNKLIVITMDTDEELDGYIKTTTFINDFETDVFKVSEDSRFSVFYGKNVETGEEGFYVYDEIDQTLMYYDDEQINLLNETIDKYTNVILGFAGMLILSFVALIIVILKKGKVKKVGNKESKKNIVNNTKSVEVVDSKIKKKKTQDKKKPKVNIKNKKKMEEDF